MLVVTDFSNGGSTSTITVYAWDPTCTKTTGSTVGACGDANLRIKGTSTNANCAAAAAANDQFCGIVNPATDHGAVAVHGQERHAEHATCRASSSRAGST